MRKLTLDPETLRVESFPAADAADARGTVGAHSYVTFGAPNAACSEEASRQCLDTDYHVYTCGASCINLCFHTGPAGCID